MTHAVNLLAGVGSQILLPYDTLFPNNFFFFLLRNTFTYSI